MASVLPRPRVARPLLLSLGLLVAGAGTLGCGAKKTRAPEIPRAVKTPKAKRYAPWCR